MWPPLSAATSAKCQWCPDSHLQVPTQNAAHAPATVAVFTAFNGQADPVIGDRSGAVFADMKCKEKAQSKARDIDMQIQKTVKENIFYILKFICAKNV